MIVVKKGIWEVAGESWVEIRDKIRRLKLDVEAEAKAEVEADGFQKVS